LISKAIEDLADEVSRKCGQVVLTLVSDQCGTYTPEAHCHILSQVTQQESPFLFLMGHSYQVIDFAPKLATMLGRGFIPNCVDYQIEAGRPVFVRQVFNGKINLQVGLKGEPPYFVSLQQGAFNAYEVQSRQSPRVVNLTVPLPDEVLKRKVLEIIQAAQGKVELSQAEIIVAGGRGLATKE